MNYYAKSKPDVLTIVEHTLDVVEAVKALAQAYGNELSFLTSKEFELVELAAMYHDLGKYSDSFQNTIRPSIEKGYKKNGTANYPHNYLSVPLIPFKEIRTTYTKEDAQIVALAVGFHHERDEQPTEEKIGQLYDQCLVNQIPLIQQSFSFPIKPSSMLSRFAVKAVCNREGIVNQFDEHNWHKYILIKGLLQRADHAASAKRKEEDVATYVEEAVERNVGEQTKAHLEKHYSLRPLQTFTYNNQQKNIVLVAQTGSGKTEAALLWIGKSKGFLTLPLRVSLNAMFDRIQGNEGIGFESTGLLHSSALDYLVAKSDEIDSFEQSVIQTDHTRLLAKKLTLSTIDQLFKFPLLYRGFETELATFAYSKMVIDEIQAYDPHIVAILLRGIELIHGLGGKWMIMTATLPQIFIDELQNKGLLDSNVLVETVLIPDDRDPEPIMPRRHRIKFLSSIEDALLAMIGLAESKKVLVVVNTVKKALAIFDQLSPLVNEQVHLLHSQFTQKDRLPKERSIKDFASLNSTASGIWITTQIVEASLDVDFDYLFTEAATPDALFQRFGRCNRKGLRFDGDVPSEPNVFIFTNLEEVSGIDSIYEKSIVENGIQMLAQFEGQLIGEQEKIHIVSTVFSEGQLVGTDYLTKFKKATQELRTMRPFERDKKEAQKILRDIQSCSFVAGRENYEVVMDLINQYENLSTTLSQEDWKKQRKKLRMEVEQYTISVNPWRLKNKASDFCCRNFKNKGFEHIWYSTDVLYDSQRGLELCLEG